jgi:hypothetical protein
MAEATANTDNSNPLTQPPGKEKIPSGKVLAGSDQYFDGFTHVGVAIEVAAAGRISHLMIPDATRVTTGAPIFITAPVRLKAANLKTFLKKKGVPIPTALDGLLSNLEIGCEAFYFSTVKRKLTDTEEDKAFIVKYIKDLALTEATTPKASEIIAGYELEDGPLLMMFAVSVSGGLISALSGDPDLGSLFDINGVMLRVLRCPASKKDILVNYVQALPQE